jgi:hypothetical protein
VQVNIEKFTFQLKTKQAKARWIAESAVSLKIKTVNALGCRVQQKLGLNHAFLQDSFRPSVLEQNENQIYHQKGHNPQQEPHLILAEGIEIRGLIENKTAFIESFCFLVGQSSGLQRKNEIDKQQQEDSNADFAYNPCQAEPFR